ncbi:MAG TPA: tripartite tricarboxylate transporter substrate binding protein [Syntrophorhabdales bacterium]|nr:tripartite tricarboxylate transporter substrate binding protein [Syntrophorhabdales bacterium]
MRKTAVIVYTIAMLVFLSGSLVEVRWALADYPDRTITLVVPYPPGGVTDLGARAFAEAMEKQLKKSVVVVNRAGGSTTMGGNVVATAKPDGYTLGYFPPAASIPEVYTYFYEAPYASKDLRPVCRVATAVGAIVVKGDSPINGLKDLVQYVRKNPGTKWGINTKTSPSYIITRAIAKNENLNIIDVAFDGDVKIVPAILGGHIPVGSPTYPSVKSLVDAKQLKLVVLLVEKRADFMPANVPIIVEFGYKIPPGMANSVFAPKGTPDDIVKKINDAAAKVSQDSAFRAKLMELGILPSFEETKSFEVSTEREKKELQVFFKEEGLVK